VLCPVGTASRDAVEGWGRRVFRPEFQSAGGGWIVSCEGLKYLLLGFFVFVIAWMPAAALQGFMRGRTGRFRCEDANLFGRWVWWASR